MAKGKVTFYEGVGKNSKKPFKALLIEVGTWSKLVFVDSRFEMDYIEKQLKSETPEPKSFLDDDEDAIL